MKLITNTEIDIEHFEKELINNNNRTIINHLSDYIELNELRIDKNKKVEYVLAYIKFWGLSTQRLSKIFLQDYFKLLLSKPEYNLEKLCLSSNGKQFSFATKLLHTFNPENPPYDSKVKNYLNIKNKSNSNSSEFYQNYCLEFKELLKMYSSKLMKLREKIKQLSGDKKVEYIKNNLSTISDVKLLDSVIWYLQKEKDKLKKRG